MAALLQAEPRTKVAIRNLPPFSPVAIRLLLLLRRESVSYREVIEVLKSDAGFSAGWR